MTHPSTVWARPVRVKNHSSQRAHTQICRHAGPGGRGSGAARLGGVQRLAGPALHLALGAVLVIGAVGSAAAQARDAVAHVE